VEIDDNKLYFDIDVSQSGGDAAIINNSTIPSMDLTKDENVSSWLFKLYLPEVGDITSVSLKWGTDSSNYWLNTTTTDYMGNALSDGENQILLDWTSATKIGTPTVSNIPYLSITISYDNTQGDDEGFWIGELAIARPEKLELTYNSWKIGRSSTGTALTAFTADTDVPFFSGQFDFFENYVAHKAAAILFKQVGLYNDASFEESEAEKEKYALKKNFPTTRIQRTKSFKVGGVNRTIRRRWLR
jgi:hypothetical protein